MEIPSEIKAGIDTRSLRSRAVGTLDWSIFWISGGFFLLFLVIALIDLNTLSSLIGSAFTWSTRFFGLYWQVLMLATFGASLYIGYTRLGRVRLGGVGQTPSISTFNWVSMIMCALLAGGGAFWAAAEPMMHFINPPPYFTAVTKTDGAAVAALSQSFLHWGFMAWAVLGSLLTVVYMYLHHEKNLPLMPRTLLYPLLGKRALKGPIAVFADASAIIAVVAGTIGPVGFLGLQIAFVLHSVWGVPNTIMVQAMVILSVTVIYTLSCVVGLGGLRLVSKVHVWLMLGLAAFLFIFGPTLFLSETFAQSLAVHVTSFFQTALYRDNSSWLNSWTLFYWGWFIGYAPMMGIYVTKVSRGRSIREVVTLMSVAAPLITMLWFTLVGGTGMGVELQTAGKVISHGVQPEALLLGVAQSLPLPNLISALFLFLSFFSVVTSAGSMSYTVAMAISTDHDESPAWLRVFWGVGMGLVGATLITLGEGGISALQSFIVITAVPVSLLILPAVGDAIRIARRMARDQGVL